MRTIFRCTGRRRSSPVRALRGIAPPWPTGWGARPDRRLVQVEGEIRDRSPEERRAARQARSRPLVEAFQRWLREKLALVSQKSKLADAIRYALSRSAGLGLFLDDGRVEIDTNVVERSIRPLAIARSFCPCRAGS